MKKIQKPAGGEYAPYAIMYINLLPDDGLVLLHLLNSVQKVKAQGESDLEGLLTFSGNPQHI